MERDSISREQVKQRMDRQIEETVKMKLCDFVIRNDEQEMLIPQVLKLHEYLDSLDTLD
jgi:dephospho-CoA kinase